jgi:hypothetical protein
VGKVINQKLARSQFIGEIQAHYERRCGRLSRTC